MVRGIPGEPGGIAALAAELAEHGEAIEFDLIALGLRREWLGTPALSWRDLWVILHHLPRDSAYARSRHGEAALWGLTDHLLATLIDAVQDGNWQRAGKKNAPRPKRVKRPGGGKAAGERKFGRDPIPIARFDDWWHGRE